LGRSLTISGISATLSITEDSTDSYGFGESGTESITTGGAAAPGTVGFLWDQMGTDDYVIDQGDQFTNTVTEGSLTYHWVTDTYLFNLTDTVSSSWHDDGADVLTDGDSVTGETDNGTWSDLNSVTFEVDEMTASVGSQTQSYVRGQGNRGEIRDS
jgi:archaellum component FlaF (FlaF/FlaG flagellin family)